MLRRLNPVYMRGFSHGVVRRQHRKQLPEPPLAQNLSCTNANPPLLATTTTSQTTQSPGSHATGTDSVINLWGTGYAGGNKPFYATPLNPAAPNFNPPQQNHSFYIDVPSTQTPATSDNPSLSRRVRTMPSRRQRSTKGAQQRDKILQPSLESGGVPDPTPDYLQLASHPPLMLPRPQNLLVVVDLNGTLLHRPNRHSPTLFVERPNARRFLSYCVNTFTVVVWSSARPQNVKNMCAQLLTPEDRSKVVAAWGRDSFGLTESDYNQRVLCYKRLTALWNDPTVAASHPEAANGKKWNQTNTVLVDDSIDKARSEPFNLIQIPDFKGDAQEPGFVLPQVHDYLNECSQRVNVSAYIKTQPFAINPQFTLRS